MRIFTRLVVKYDVVAGQQTMVPVLVTDNLGVRNLLGVLFDEVANCGRQVANLSRVVQHGE